MRGTAKGVALALWAVMPPMPQQRRSISAKWGGKPYTLGGGKMSYKDPEVQREYQRKWRNTRRKEYIKKHGGKCVQCGSKHRLEFDHVDRSRKVEHKIWTWKRARIEEELKKCQLLCKRCHINKTHAERGDRVIVHGTLYRGYHHGCRCSECRRANAAYENKRRHGKSMSV